MFPPNDQFPLLPNGGDHPPAGPPPADDLFADLPIVGDDEEIVVPNAEENRAQEVLAAGLHFYEKMKRANKKEP